MLEETPSTKNIGDTLSNNVRIERPFLITLIAVGSCLIAVLLFLVTVFSLLSNSPHPRPVPGGGTAITGRIFLALATVFSSFLVLGLFRFRRWAVVFVGVLAAACGNYALARLFVAKSAVHSIVTWSLLLGSFWLAWCLLVVLSPKGSVRDPDGIRPFGVSAIAAVGLTALLLAPLTLLYEARHGVAGWDMASHIFNFALSGALSFGLLKLREWARLLTEITSFLAPLAVLPSLIRPTSHTNLSVSLAISVLMYATWSIWYLRQERVVSAFEHSETANAFAT
jgi:hypothetical protein